MAIVEGDLQTVALVLAAPTYLTGLKPAHHELVREQAARSWAKETQEVLDSVNWATGHVRKMGQQFIGSFDEIRALGRIKAPAAPSKERADKALAKLNTGTEG